MGIQSSCTHITYASQYVINDCFALLFGERSLLTRRASLCKCCTSQNSLQGEFFEPILRSWNFTEWFPLSKVNINWSKNHNKRTAGRSRMFRNKLAKLSFSRTDRSWDNQNIVRFWCTFWAFWVCPCTNYVDSGNRSIWFFAGFRVSRIKWSGNAKIQPEARKLTHLKNCELFCDI